MELILVGSGRLAKHLLFYTQSLRLKVRAVSGREWIHTDNTWMQPNDRVLLALPDQVLAEAVAHVPPNMTVVHFSGASIVEGAFAAHPLMTFGPELMSLEAYRQISFCLDEGTDLAHLIPGLPNPWFTLPREKRVLYHAICALIGNSAHHLFAHARDVWIDDLQLDPKLLKPYLHRMVEAAMDSGLESWTGPVARGDALTVERHLANLSAHPQLLGAYQDFIHRAKQGEHAP
jgi:2-dehydropantoate 2-reductase